jgi:hypothetical protein
MQATEQMTDAEIQSILDRNNLFISYNEKTKEHELFRKVGKRQLRLSACKYKTALIVSARTIDRNRK